MRQRELATILGKNWLSLSALFIFALALGYLGVREFWRWWVINQEYQNIQEEIITLNSRSGELKEELADLSRPELMEKEARARLNLKREGEAVLIVVSDDDFPEEDFLKAKAGGLFAPLKSAFIEGLNNPESIWFNLNNWKTYLFP